MCHSANGIRRKAVCFAIRSGSVQESAVSKHCQMQKWIDQSKKRLLDIIDQLKKDAKNLVLRVAYIG